MSYSNRKDVALHLCNPPYRFEIDGQGQMLQVGVFRYNGGEPKIGIQRKVMKSGQMSPARLGRLTLDEANYIFGTMNEAITELKKIKEAEGA